MSEWPKILIDIDKNLFAHFALNTYQRALYFHLVTQTFAQDRDAVTLTIPQISTAIAASEFTGRRAIRELSEKGVVDAKQTRRGYKIRLFLPSELNIPDNLGKGAEPEVDLDAIDFFRNRMYLKSLMKREDFKCFYCFTKITEDDCELDHVTSQLEGGGNGYRNIVAACHNCNTRKQAQDASDFLRSLFRRGLLSETEFSERLKALELLKSGDLIPEIHHLPT